jgi:hypothetical protein
MRTTDPKPGESASAYLDRILGAPGSPMRALDTFGAYEYYLQIWTAFQRQPLR